MLHLNVLSGKKVRKLFVSNTNKFLFCFFNSKLKSKQRRMEKNEWLDTIYHFFAKAQLQNYELRQIKKNPAFFMPCCIPSDGGMSDRGFLHPAAFIRPSCPSIHPYFHSSFLSSIPIFILSFCHPSLLSSSLFSSIPPVIHPSCHPPLL